ncbi:hypothetical protein OB905_09550 [Halobacteria archaeon AArc-dxtr1]|nr:hypothetical protein [Halobacteria archaeon AArc-dxtr1]
MPADRDPDGDTARQDRLERAEERRKRAARAARARSSTQSPQVAENGSGDGGPNRGRLFQLSMYLRTVAFALLVVGFIGLTVADGWLSPTESPYALVFGGGIVCAIASIYLAIYQHDGAEA